MNQKPLITIDKFQGQGINGILYCEGLYPEINNGKSVMSEGFYTSSVFNTSTTGMANIGTTKSILSLSTLYNENITYNLYYSGLKIHASSDYSTDITNGLLHTTAGLITKPDMIETTNGNILYTQENYIGLGIRGKATGGSTTTLIDTTRHFGGSYKGAYDSGTTYAQYDYVSYNGKWYACKQSSTGNVPTNTTYWLETIPNEIAVNDTITNLKTGIIYKITSITTTTNQNDTLNFSASGTNTTVANNEYIAWDNDKHNITLTKQNWQEGNTYWAKQIKLYGDQYIFTNGNYLGIISADEETVDPTYKQLPAQHQALSMDINVSSILVSCSYSGKGSILFWDGSSDGWNNIYEYDRPVLSVINYNIGFIFVSNGVVYYTNGYQVQKLYEMNSTRKLYSSINPVGFNSLCIYDNMLYCANSYRDNNLIDIGVYAINLGNVNDGFTLIRCIKTTKNNGTPDCIFLSNRFSISSTILVGGDSFVDQLNYGNSGGQYRNKSMILMVSLPTEHRITGVGLNLSRYIKNYVNDINTTRSRVVQVAVGDGKRGLIDYAYTTATGYYGTSILPYGTNYFPNTEIGDEIVSSQEDYIGDRAFITNITGKGEAGEIWTVDTAVSSVSNDRSALKMLRVKNFGKKTITSKELNNEVLYTNTNGGILSNKIFIEIVFYGQNAPMPLDINEIKIYGD